MQAIQKPHRDGEDVEQALIMLGVGVNTHRVSEVTGIPYTTLRDWANSPELVAKYGSAIKAARERLAYRTSQIFDRELDKVEDGEVTVSPLQAATMWGIATDKVQKESSPSQQASYTIVRTSDGTEIEVGMKSG